MSDPLKKSIPSGASQLVLLPQSIQFFLYLEHPDLLVVAS